MAPACVIDADLISDFPELTLLEMTVDVARARRRVVRDRLVRLSERVSMQSAKGMRLRSIPSAYRAFARQIGLDPDADTLPLEWCLTERVKAGCFESRSVVDDACLVATLETGVPVWALDARHARGALRLAPAFAGDERAGELAVWDALGPLIALFGRVSDDVAVTAQTTSARLLALRVPGVPQSWVRQALLTACEVAGHEP